MAAGPLQPLRLLLGDAGVPERRPAVAGHRQPPPLGLEGKGCGRPLVAQQIGEAGIGDIAQVDFAAGGERDQAGCGADRQRVDPAARRFGELLRPLRPRPDQSSVVAAADDPLAGGVDRPAKDRAIVG